MDGDPGTADVELNHAESTQASVSQCTPTKCNYNNDKYKLEQAKCKRDLYTTDVPLFQPTNFNDSLQKVTENSYAANTLKCLHT